MPERSEARVMLARHRSGQVEHLSGSEQRLWWHVSEAAGEDYDRAEEGCEDVVGRNNQGGHKKDWLERLF